MCVTLISVLLSFFRCTANPKVSSFLSSAAASYFLFFPLPLPPLSSSLSSLLISSLSSFLFPPFSPLLFSFFSFLSSLPFSSLHFSSLLSSCFSPLLLYSTLLLLFLFSLTLSSSTFPFLGEALRDGREPSEADWVQR